MKKVLKYMIVFIISIAIIILGINLYIILSTKRQIIKEKKTIKNYQTSTV